MREFDLNIERVLENWTVAHALREVIANALDEQALTGTRRKTPARDRRTRLRDHAPDVLAAIRICPLAATKKTPWPSQNVTGFASRRTATLPRTIPGGWKGARTAPAVAGISPGFAYAALSGSTGAARAVLCLGSGRPARALSRPSASG